MTVVASYRRHNLQANVDPCIRWKPQTQ